MQGGFAVFPSRGIDVGPTVDEFAYGNFTATVSSIWVFTFHRVHDRCEAILASFIDVDTFIQHLLKFFREIVYYRVDKSGSAGLLQELKVRFWLGGDVWHS